MNDFLERFKKHSDVELLKIMESPGIYEADAIAAAGAVLESRQLTVAEMELAKIALADAHAKTKADDERNEKLFNKIKGAGNSLVDALHPVQKKPVTNDRLILIISGLLAIIFLYRVYVDFDLLLVFFRDFKNWDFSTLMYLLPFCILPLAAVLFYLRTKAGWIFTAIFMTYSVAGSLALFFWQLNREPSGIPMLDLVFPAVPVETLLSSVVFFGAGLWTISRKSMREIYKVERKAMIITIVVTAIVSVMIIN